MRFGKTGVVMRVEEIEQAAEVQPLANHSARRRGWRRLSRLYAYSLLPQKLMQ
jgi:hypothetical protein